MSDYTHYLICPEFDNPDGSRYQDPLYLYNDRERAWGAIQHILKVYTQPDYAKFAPRRINIYHFELNSARKKHIFYYWDEALNYALNDQNPLP